MPRRFVHEHLPYLLARASHALWRGFEPVLREAGLNSLEWRVLAVLSDGETLAVGRLAAEVLAKQPTVSKTLDRLQQQGLLERRADGGDARRSLVAITPAGRRKVAPLLKAAQAHGQARLAALAVKDAQVLRESLLALVQHYDASEADA